MGQYAQNDSSDHRLYQIKSPLATIPSDSQVPEYPVVLFKKTGWIILLFSIGLLLPVSAFAQGATSAKAKAALEKGKNSVLFGNWEEAQIALEEAVKLDPQLFEAHLYLADVYYYQKNWEEAAWHYKLVHDNDPKAPLRVLLYAAESNFNHMEYETAAQQVKHFMMTPGISNSQKDKAFKIQRDIFFAKDASKRPVPFEPVNLGPSINTVDHEYLPSLTADSRILVFTRRLMGQEDLYESIRKDTGWSRANPLTEINTRDNEGAHCISADGNLLLFTACNRTSGLGSCDIFYSPKILGKWKAPSGIGRPINSESWESQPSLSADGRTLFYSSDKPGGYGTSDIWVSYLDANNKWTNPINLGSTVNTAGSDQSPFLHPDGVTLYFSSDGHPGMGGTDLYFTRWDGKKWTTPVNLGYPINTSGNEGSLIVSLDGTTGYYASDRPGGHGKLDIYSFAMPEFARPLATSYVKVLVNDGVSGAPLDATFIFTDLSTGNPVLANTTNPTGSFLACLPAGKNYGLTIQKDGYLFFSENINLQLSSATHPFEFSVTLHPIEKDKTIILNNIFFSFGQHTLEPASFSELEKLTALLIQNPGIKAEISGHTDNIGTDAANQLLSQKRAETVVSYLLEKGIPANRLIAKGYGSSVPLANNATEEGRAKNRRTEFKIIE
jgi:outer membrane protein OmpA-like peptidoglycan-associated protein